MASTSRTTLKETGLRVTRKRALIMDIIQKGHLSADEIFLQARKKEPHLNLSTVYRTLQKLKAQGLVEEIHLDDSHHRYELKPAGEHYHLVCSSCGRVTEVYYPLLRSLQRSARETAGFDIAEAEVRLSGMCARCRQQREKNPGEKRAGDNNAA